MRSLANQRGNTVLYLVIGVLLIFIAGGLILHYGLKRHAILPYDVAAAYQCALRWKIAGSTAHADKAV